MSVMRRAILVAVALSCLGTGNVEAGFFDGNALLEACEKRATFCQGYIAAVHDTMAQPFLTAGSVNSGKICVPADVKLSQLVDVSVLYLRARPEKRHLDASFLVFDALKEKFPCN
jgi:hypothetical protein